MKTGHLFLLVGPSGSGKTAIIEGVIQTVPHLHRYVTYTTRPPRPGEINGCDYYFINRVEFDRLKLEQKMVESQESYGQLYGSLREQIDTFIQRAKDGIAAYDIFGAKEMSTLYPENVVTIFIMPPSFEEIRSRIIERYGADDNESRLRIERFDTEMQYVGEFDYTVRNVHLHEAIADVECIIRIERCATKRKRA